MSSPKPSNEPNIELYTIPSHSSWFSWADIHDTERSHLSEFFDGSSITRTPKIYKEYRDFIISKYRECPTRRLSFTEARKSLVGDVSLLHKVFRFLDTNGLINFGAVAEEEEREGQWKVKVEDGVPLGTRVVAFSNAKAAVLTVPPGRIGGRTVGNGSMLPPPLASYRDVYGDKKGVVCRNCKQRCDSAYHQCEKDRGCRICSKCFNNGKYGKDNSIDDFKRIGDISNCETYSSVWTEAETLLLLDSVSKHGDDWDHVAENVKTKNKADCISKLIQLPFGDLMLGSAYGKGRFLNNGSNKSTGPVRPVTEQLTPLEAHPTESKNTKNQGPIVENERKQNGIAEAENETGKAEIESKEHGKAEAENEIAKAENETGKAEIESKENAKTEIESEENAKAESENGKVHIESEEIGKAENESGKVQTESKEIGNAENENGKAEVESKVNGKAEHENEKVQIESEEIGNAETKNENENNEIEHKETGNADIESKENKNAVNQLSSLKRKRITSSSDTGSCLMKQVALLSSVVDPRITACAAEAAISDLCDEIQCPREIFDDYDTEDEEDSEVDEMDIDGKSPTTESREMETVKNALPFSLQMRAATATALGATAARAKLLANQEDREIEILVANIIETQMKKVQHKSKYFDDLELIMEKEYCELEDLKDSIIADRVNVRQSVFKEKTGSRDQNPAKPQTGVV